MTLNLPRALAVVTALGLGSGCIIESSPNLGGAYVYWTFHSFLAGNIGAFTDSSLVVCGLAGVDEIEITFTTPAGDVLAPVAGWCVTGNDVPGAAFYDMEPGTWDALVVGLRGGLPVFDTSVTFNVYDGSNTTVDTRLEANYYDARVDYTVSDLGGCTGIELETFQGTSVTPFYTTYPATTDPGLDVVCAASGSRVIPSLPPGVYVMGPWVEYDSLGAFAYSECNPTWTQPPSGDKVFSLAINRGTQGIACTK